MTFQSDRDSSSFLRLHWVVVRLSTTFVNALIEFGVKLGSEGWDYLFEEAYGHQANEAQQSLVELLHMLHSDLPTLQAKQAVRTSALSVASRTFLTGTGNRAPSCAHITIRNLHDGPGLPQFASKLHETVTSTLTQILSELFKGAWLAL